MGKPKRKEKKRAYSTRLWFIELDNFFGHLASLTSTIYHRQLVRKKKIGLLLSFCFLADLLFIHEHERNLVGSNPLRAGKTRLFERSAFI